MTDPDRFLIDKRLARRSFERAAAGYDGAAVLQREVGDRMAARLDLVKLAPTAILDVGCGTGYGARELSRRYPDADTYCLDLALAMLSRARAAVPWWRRRFSRLRYVGGDLERLPFKTASVELVWCNLALQWSNVPDQAFAEARRVLRPQGLYLFSTFGPDTLKELRAAYGALDDRTHVNRFIDMHDLGDLLTRAGFQDPVMEMEQITVSYDELRRLLGDLKAIGAHNVTRGRPPGLSGKGGLERLVESYERFRREGRLPATYEVVYGHAWKPAGRDDGRQAIQLHRKRP